jgi:hypothetical protein
MPLASRSAGRQQNRSAAMWSCGYRSLRGRRRATALCRRRTSRGFGTATVSLRTATPGTVARCSARWLSPALRSLSSTTTLAPAACCLTTTTMRPMRARPRGRSGPTPTRGSPSSFLTMIRSRLPRPPESALSRASTCWHRRSVRRRFSGRSVNRVSAWRNSWPRESKTTAAL